jgi:2-isopropylmalate synthase
MTERAITHDWNHHGPHADAPRKVALHDETLRDGLQSPSVTDPGLDDKLAILRGLNGLGIDTADVGLPGAGDRARAEIEALVRLTAEESLSIRPTVACRTHEADIIPAIEIAQRTGVALEAMMFLGTSPIRLYAEGWDEDRLERLTRASMRMAVAGGLGATFVTEDTVRSHPDTLRRLFTAAIEEGATCLILCDTVGHATPAGTRNLVGWTLNLLDELGVADRVTVDWHGHDDRGLSLINTLAAAEAGAHRLHGSILGIGERVGNTALDQVMVNLRLLGVDDRDLSGLYALAQLVSRATDTPIPPNYPVLGDDAFRTATGVHAAAVIKASRKGDLELADRVYSGVPARWVGREQEIAIGFMSGASNVRWWLERRGIEPLDEVVEAVLNRAKGTKRLLTDEEIVTLASQAVLNK